MQTRIAVNAVIGSSPRMCAAIGLTVATGSREKHMIRKPIDAFQNPIVDHGSVAAKSARKAMERRWPRARGRRRLYPRLSRQPGLDDEPARARQSTRQQPAVSDDRAFSVALLPHC